MTTMRTKIGAYLELARISNAPTVATNALVGCAVAGVGRSEGIGGSWKIAMAGAGVVLMYISGMALNDAMDAKVDAVERSGRAIPSGRVSRRAAFVFGFACLVSGWAMLAVLSPGGMMWGGILAAAILAYDLLHRMSGFAVVLMGACRGLAYLASAAAVAWPVDLRVALIFAGFTTAYVILLSLVARGEAGEGGLGWRKWVGMAVPLVVMGWAVLLLKQRAVEPACPLMAALAAAGWAQWWALRLWKRPAKVVNSVMGWLAGICLLDASFLVMMQELEMAAIACGCFVLTILMQRRILGS